MGLLDLPEVSAKGFSHPLTIALRINPRNSFGLGAFSIFNGPNCLVICFFATVKPFNILFSPGDDQQCLHRILTVSFCIKGKRS